MEQKCDINVWLHFSDYSRLAFQHIVKARFFGWSIAFPFVLNKGANDIEESFQSYKPKWLKIVN